MRRIGIYLFLLSLISSHLFGQVTTEPPFPEADEPITFTVDVSGTNLAGYTDNVWIWAWVDNATGDVDAPTNVNPATDSESDALMTRSTEDSDVYTITFTPTEFFDRPAEEIETIGLLLKGRDWSNGQTPDYLVEISSGGFEVSFATPSGSTNFLQPAENFLIEASASENSSITLFINDEEVTTVADAMEIEYLFSSEEAGRYELKVIADNGSTIAEDNSYLIISAPSVEEERPAGIIAGINYDNSNTSEVTLDLWAPNKDIVYLIGDFNNWEVSPEYQMKKDGEHFWLTISGLEAGEQYGYQYLVDEELFIADPFADMILDPDDQYIPEKVYPSLKAYPEEAAHDDWYFNRVSVLETGQEPYQWKNEPVDVAVDSLIIYELLIRDFFEDGERSYANLTDTLTYLKELGINAIELMPVMEFNGNNSWGYNPTFMFAPDKYYGPKDELKRFIDEAHGMDMAVILDIAMNHQDMPNSFVMMYFDYTNFKPTADNPWFNVDATHPFNVFFDMDHESTYTQQYLDTVNYYWLTEYKVDGFRYDLSKGFTQNNTGGNVGAWSAYDASRIDLIKRMGAEIREYAPDALLILEHFADNTEEKELAEEGFLLWGNLNHSYSQAAMGYADDADISWGYYGNRGWDNPNLITYMESHDEERVSYRVKQFGASSTDYSTRDISTRIERLKASALFTYALPGPKMIWQWGEWGYDIPIDENGRTGIKPIPWNNIDGLDYNHSGKHQELYGFYKALLNMRREYPVFSFGDAEITNSGALLKQITITSDPYEANPSSPDNMNAVIIGNFDVSPRQMSVTFPHAGEWYSYFNNADINASTTSTTLTLAPGEFRLLTDVELEEPDLITEVSTDLAGDLNYYPNPVKEQLVISSSAIINKVKIYDLPGNLLEEQNSDHTEINISVQHLPKGIYIVEVFGEGKREVFKIVKE